MGRGPRGQCALNFSAYIATPYFLAEKDGREREMNTEREEKIRHFQIRNLTKWQKFSLIQITSLLALSQ